MAQGIFVFILSVLLTTSVCADPLSYDSDDSRDNPLTKASIEGIVGEQLGYDIGFLMFDKLAKGQSRFSKTEEEGVYEAFLEAKTRGMAALFTQHRRQRYVARMAVGPEGKLRTLVYESHMIKGKSDYKRDRSKRYVFDYKNRQIVFSRGENGTYGEEKILPMPNEGDYFDILTAFYNVRLGFFGDVVRGARFEIPSLTRKGPSQIIVEVLTQEEQGALDAFPSKGLVCRVEIDKEIFDTEEGGIYIWFDESGRPAAGVVENVLGLGNVYGSLR